MTTYQKLADVGAIWTADTNSTDTFYSLEVPKSLPNGGRALCVFVDMVFQANHFENFEIPMPDAVAVALCKSTITFDEYLHTLRVGGFDVDELLRKSKAAEDKLDASMHSCRTKAEDFFELLQREWIVSNEDVARYINSESIYDLLELVLEHADSTRARLKARVKHANDPKQKDKLTVRECWQAWQKEPSRYKGKAAFARDMRDKFPNLESQPVIERWCREWETQNITQQAG